MIAFITRHCLVSPLKAPSCGWSRSRGHEKGEINPVKRIIQSFIVVGVIAWVSIVTLRSDDLPPIIPGVEEGIKWGDLHKPIVERHNFSYSEKRGQVHLSPFLSKNQVRIFTISVE